jgi:hypothetical protein
MRRGSLKPLHQFPNTYRTQNYTARGSDWKLTFCNRSENWSQPMMAIIDRVNAIEWLSVLPDDMVWFSRPAGFCLVGRVVGCRFVYIKLPAGSQA